MNQLDAVDRKLLYELDGNSRLTTSQLARLIKEGRDRVEYRLERLKTLQILKACTVTINPYLFGLTLYKTYLKLEKKHGQFDSVLSYLSKHPKVYWIANCDGRWDLIFSTFAKSPYEFHALQHEILSKFSELIISANFFTLVNVSMHRKGFLIGKGSPHFAIGGEPANLSLDQLEWNILKLLSKDARMNVVDIAKKLKTTEAIVHYRISRLEEVGLIAGYRIELNLQKLNMMFFKAQLYLRDHSKATRKALQKFAEEQANISYFIEQLGECDVELELEVKDYQEYTAIINEVRLKFGKAIRNIETVLVQESWFNWIPYEVAAS